MQQSTSKDVVPRLKVLPIEQLQPYANNARTHSTSQIAQIAASIAEFGFTNPVLIDPKGQIIAGHGRVAAAKQLGLTEVPCIELADLTPAQVRAYVIADNKLALNAGWDYELLVEEFRNLDTSQIELLGFSQNEIDSILGNALKTETSEPQLGGMQFAVIVDCTSEQHQAELMAQFERDGLKCRMLIS
jgi:ParB-like chromosome segregation protein Spo0J